MRVIKIPIEKAKQHLLPLTALRFIAASLIVVHHTRYYFGYGDSLANFIALDNGVSFFFVLSGFILFYTYEKILSGGYAWRFYVARMARIWPLHVATFLLVLFALPRSEWWFPGNTLLPNAVANILLIQSWIPWPSYFLSFNALSWSLSVETFFYLSFPFIVRSWNDTWWWKVTLCLIAVVALVEVANFAHLSSLADHDVVTLEALVYIFPLARLFEFVIGIASASLWIRIRSTMGTVDRWAATMLEIGAAVLVIAAMHWVPRLATEFFNAGWMGEASATWLFESGSAVPFAVFIFVFASSGGLLSTVLSLRPLVFLGEISFSVYMVHQVLMRLAGGGPGLAALGTMQAQYAGYWFALLLLSTAFWIVVEKPCRKLIMSAVAIKGPNDLELQRHNKG